MKLKTFKNLFIYLILFTPLSLGMISCSGNNKSNAKFKEEITADIIPPITAVAALGQLSPSGEIRQLAAPISQFGSSPRIIEILVNEGDFVKKGDILAIFENNKKLEDDILIVFKIKPEKTIDDLLNLPNKIDQIDEMIPINRENKINFLNYIYRTNDNYIIASSDKKLIKNSIISSENFKKKKFQYERELFGLKNQKNILFTKKFGESIFFDKEIFTNKNEDIVATTFDLKNKHLILKS